MKKSLGYQQGLFILLVMILIVTSGCVPKAGEKNTQTSDSSRKISGQAAQVTATSAGEQRSAGKLSGQEVKEVTVYFLTENEDYLVPVTIPIKLTEQGAKASLERLIVGSGDEIIKPVIHPSTKLKDIYVKDNIIYLDLTEHFLNFSSAKKGEMVIASILKTLSPYTGGRAVQLLADGKAIDRTAGRFNLSIPLSLDSGMVKGEGEQLITVYFAEPNGIYLVPVEKKIKTSDAVTAALKELVKGPGEQSGLIPTLWHGTKLLGVTVTGDLAEVNLSKEVIGYGGGSAAENLFVKSLLLTATEFSHINQVQLLFEGERLDFLPEGTAVGKPLERPEFINYKP
jgi:germination protein M